MVEAQGGALSSLLKTLFGSKTRVTSMLFAALAAMFYVIHKRQQKEKRTLMRSLSEEKIRQAKNKQKGNVDKEFFRRLPELLKIAIPSWKSKEAFKMLLLTIFLIVRTYLSISLASVNGAIVKAIVKRKFPLFIKRLIILAAYALPASFVNSLLDYLQKEIALGFRVNLTKHFHERYLKKMVYYQLTNLDSRITVPDQRLTQDIEKWCFTLATLYSNFTKPLFDIVLFSEKLAQVLGWQGPASVMAGYWICGVLIRFISPPFGALTAVQQKLEGEYRRNHNDILSHSEEIAFYNGGEWEDNRLSESFSTLIKHVRKILGKRLFLGTFDSLLTKYGIFILGYSVLSLPVFGPGAQPYDEKTGDEAGAITQDYMRNSSLLINLSKAIGRIVVSYKDIQHLAGYTTLIHELKNSITDLENDRYDRKMISGSEYKDSNQRTGVVVQGDCIKFEDLPVVSPNGDLLINKMTFEIKPGMHCFIAGPNGCGKSSLFRILGELWPVFAGKLTRPAPADIFYIPQKPYLPTGSLRDQVIYPDNKLNMLRKRVKDTDLQELLRAVHLEYLIAREGGWDACNEWIDVLSGGEKQRMAIARLLYHKPKFAIFDECTSAVSVDVEGKLYTVCKDRGITLLTTSHRNTLWGYHDYMIRLDGEGGWTFSEIDHKNLPSH